MIRTGVMQRFLLVRLLLNPMPNTWEAIFLGDCSLEVESMRLLVAVNHTKYYSNYNDTEGIPEAVQPHEMMQLDTSAGPLVPIYSVEDHGRRQLAPVRLHKNGAIKSISLQEATVIQTSAGPVSAELVTFYENGAIARVFPLNGKLSGYWSERNEYDLAKEIAVSTPLGVINVRPIYLHFHETGELKSITLWPFEQLQIDTPIGRISVKRGLSFHRNGALASCEPVAPLTVETPLGAIEAFDPDPNGMSGESNSLSFTEDGDIEGLSTVATTVQGTTRHNETMSFSPLVQRSRCSDTVFVLDPLKIRFKDNEIIFRNGMRPRKSIPASSDFRLKPFHTDKQLGGATCAS